MAEGMRAIRGYVTARDGEQFTRLADGVVMLSVSHEHLIQKHVELKFDLHMTIFEVKSKIYRHSGTKAEFQKLMLKGFDGETLYELADNSKMLGYYSVQSGMSLHVIDLDPHSMSRGGGFEDVSLVEKYRMTDEEYDNREGTLRAWKKEQQLKDPNFKYKHKQLFGLSEDAVPDEEFVVPDAETVKNITVGDRCEVAPGGRRGEVMWVGEFQNKGGKLKKKSTGYWVGVKFDEPVGKCNGTNRGVEYFKTGDKFGGFVRGEKVTVGDFPENIDFSDSDEEI